MVGLFVGWECIQSSTISQVCLDLHFASGSLHMCVVFQSAKYIWRVHSSPSVAFSFAGCYLPQVGLQSHASRATGFPHSLCTSFATLTTLRVSFCHLCPRQVCPRQQGCWFSHHPYPTSKHYCYCQLSWGGESKLLRQEASESCCSERNFE